MNLAGFSKVHHTNLQAGKTYFLKTRFGEATVEVLAITMDGIQVEIKDGGFYPPLRKRVGKGETSTIPDDSGEWYEPK